MVSRVELLHSGLLQWLELGYLCSRHCMSGAFCYLHTLRPPLEGPTSCNRSGAETLLAGTGFTMAVVRAGCIWPYKVGHFFGSEISMVNIDLIELQGRMVQGLSESLYSNFASRLM